MKLLGSKFTFGRMLALGTGLSWVFMLVTSQFAVADHISLHSTLCNEPDTVGGGTLGLSPNAALGWNAGSGQCNGSFVVTRSPQFQSDSGGGIELGLRAQKRRVGQVPRRIGNEFVVETGYDTTAPIATNRAWWNFDVSIAYDGDILTLKSLKLKIETIVGPNKPRKSEFDLLGADAVTDDRYFGSTPEYSSIYQFSHNPEFGWFAPTSDTDGNPSLFDYAAEGMWRFTLKAESQDGSKADVTMCVRTRGAGPLQDSFSPCSAKELKKSRKFSKI